MSYDSREKTVAEKISDRNKALNLSNQCLIDECSNKELRAKLATVQRAYDDLLNDYMDLRRVSLIYINQFGRLLIKPPIFYAYLKRLAIGSYRVCKAFSLSIFISFR